MRYIKDMRDGDQIHDTYLCKQKNALKTKAGKNYYALTLQDKTGTIDAKVWDLNNGIGSFETGDFINVTGNITLYQSNPQLSLTRIRKASDGEYDPNDYMPVTERDMNEMCREMSAYIASVKEPHLNALLRKIYVEDPKFAVEFKNHSAAKSMHHGFIGGLLEHTLAVTSMCDFLCGRYPFLKRDLLITAALLHDVGKVEELSAFPKNDYTDEGQLLGHIYIGACRVERTAAGIEGFPQVLLTELVHCILSHHGKLEFGSPKKPSLAEAVALNFADDCDAKMEAMKEMFSESKEVNERFIYSRMMDNNMRKTEGIK